jgi:hypothetical protein
MAFQSQKHHQQIFSRRQSSSVLLQNAAARAVASTSNHNTKRQDSSSSRLVPNLDTSSDHDEEALSLANTSREEDLENALQDLSKQVNTDVNLLQHLEDDFRADLERIEQGFDGVFSSARESIAQVNLGQLFTLLTMDDHNSDSFSNTAYDRDDLSSDIGGSIGNDTNLEQTAEMKEMLQMVDMEFMEQDRMKFRHPDEEIKLFRAASSKDDIGDYSSVISEVDEDEEVDSFVNRGTIPNAQTTKPYPLVENETEEQSTTNKIPPDQFVYETPHKTATQISDPSYHQTKIPNHRQQPLTEGSAPTISPPPPTKTNAKTSIAFPSLRNMVQRCKDLASHSFSNIYLPSKSMFKSSSNDSSSQIRPTDTDTDTDEDHYIRRQLTPSLSPTPTPTPLPAPLTKKLPPLTLADWTWKHRKKFVAVLIIPVGASLVAAIGGGQVQNDTTTRSNAERGDSSSTSFLFQMGSIFQYQEWVDMAMCIYGGELY